MVPMGPALFCCFRQVVALYRLFCPRLVQLGPGVVAVKKERWLPLTTIDKFHSSDNTLSENAAYQLVSGTGSQWRRYTSTKSLSAAQLACSTVPILNAHCHCSLWPGLAMERCTQMIKR